MPTKTPASQTNIMVNNRKEKDLSGQIQCRLKNLSLLNGKIDKKSI